MFGRATIRLGIGPHSSYTGIHAEIPNMLNFTLRRYASSVCAMALCLSVCLSVIRRSSLKTAKDIITQTTPRDSLRGLEFAVAKDFGDRFHFRSWRLFLL